jgi:aminoglycoside 6'-N-acetyltransferase
VEPELTGEYVRLRPLVEADATRLTEVLTQPEVAAWWGLWHIDRVRAELIAPDEEAVVLAIETKSEVIGIVQYAEEPDPEYRHAGIDIAIHPDWHGRGLGADTIRTVARYLFDERGHHRLTIDPAADNVQAIRSYEQVGFRPVGVMRQYERGPDGTWHDGLLMELLRDELRWR